MFAFYMSNRDSVLINRLAHNLVRLRRAKHLSQEELALKSGVDRTFVSGCERCVRNPSLTTIEKIASGLGEDPGRLFDPVE